MICGRRARRRRGRRRWSKCSRRRSRTRGGRPPPAAPPRGRRRSSQSAAAMSAAYCLLAPDHPLHGPYHDLEYGFPAADEAVLFERLVLEINQAGLSWLTVLKKRAAFRAAFADFA